MIYWLYTNVQTYIDHIQRDVDDIYINIDRINQILVIYKINIH